MPLTLHLLFEIVALVLFIVAALGVSAGRFGLVAAGLAFFTLASIFG